MTWWIRRFADWTEAQVVQRAYALGTCSCVALPPHLPVDHQRALVEPLGFELQMQMPKRKRGPEKQGPFCVLASPWGLLGASMRLALRASAASRRCSGALPATAPCVALPPHIPVGRRRAWSNPRVRIDIRQGHKPKRGLQTNAGPFSVYGVPMGIRTPVTAVKGRCPRPLDDGDGEPSS